MSDDIYNVIVGAASDINKIYKEDVAVPGRENNLADVRCIIPTTSYLLNKLLGGGVSAGRVIEILGDFSTGKSSLAETIMIGFQQYPGLSILLDAESTWHRGRAIAMGHNNDHHMHLQVSSLEQGIDVIDTTVTRLRMPGKGIPADWPICIVWDTVSNSGTEEEIEDGADDEEDEDGKKKKKDGMMAKPRKLRSLMRKWSLKLPRMLCSLIFVSQTYVGPPKKGAYVAQKQTSGGGAIKFWSSQRIEVWRAGGMDYPYDGAGIVLCAKTIKDKTNPPNREVNLPMLFKTGIHPVYELVNFILDNDEKKQYLRKDKAVLSLVNYPNEGENTSYYFKELDAIVKDDPSIMDYLKCIVDEVWVKVYR
jgi:recombination protein RecA